VAVAADADGIVTAVSVGSGKSVARAPKASPNDRNGPSEQSARSVSRNPLHLPNGRPKHRPPKVKNAEAAVVAVVAAVASAANDAKKV
jgi:hypothetical protein